MSKDINVPELRAQIVKALGEMPKASATKAEIRQYAEGLAGLLLLACPSDPASGSTRPSGQVVRTMSWPSGRDITEEVLKRLQIKAQADGISRLVIKGLSPDQAKELRTKSSSLAKKDPNWVFLKAV